MTFDLLLWSGLGLSIATVALGLLVCWIYRAKYRAMWLYFRSPEFAADRQRLQLRRATGRQERRRRRLIRKEARRIGKGIIANLTRQGMARVQEKRGAVTVYTKIRLEAVIMTDDAIYYKIDNRTPFGITFTDLAQPDVSENLSAAIQRESRVHLSTDYGCWVIVGLRSGVASIPKLFPWKSEHTERNATELLPKTKQYVIPIGVAENYKFAYADIRDLIHVLVAGTTGGGKSMFMNQALLTMINRNPPHLLKLALVDLKGGLEFMPYEHIPHLLAPICYERTDVPKMLQMFRAEKERRFTMLRERGVKDITAWNAIERLKLAHWVLVFDEIQNLVLDTKIKAAVEDLLADIAFQGRAVGLSIWLCTQFPEKKVISTAIRANTPTKICFSTTITGSMLVLDDTAAAKLPLGGRGIFRMAGRENILVQTPYLGSLTESKKIDKKSEQAMIQNEIAAAIKKWQTKEEKTDTAALDLFRTLLSDYAGKASKRLCIEVSHMSERTLLKAFTRWDYDLEKQEPIIELDDGYYILGTVPQIGGYGRWVIPIHAPPASQEEIEMAYHRSLSGESGGDAQAEPDDTVSPPEAGDYEGWGRNGNKSGDIEGGSDESGDLIPEVEGGFF